MGLALPHKSFYILRYTFAQVAGTRGGLMGLLRIAQSPIIAVKPEDSVIEAVRIMDRERIGAVLVMEDREIRGIFSERDVMLRVVLDRRDPDQTRMRDVMTSPVETIQRSVNVDEALKMMLDRHIRHLPVVNTNGEVEGMLSIRNMLHEKVEELTMQLDSLEAYFTADGSGG